MTIHHYFNNWRSVSLENCKNFERVPKCSCKNHQVLRQKWLTWGRLRKGRPRVTSADPKHTSRLCKGYLTKKEGDGVQHQMTWPPQSPDLNPMEMVWDEMDRRVKAKGPTSAQHLWELLKNYWKSTSGDDLMKLNERMPRVCKTVIKAKGGCQLGPKYISDLLHHDKHSRHLRSSWTSSLGVPRAMWGSLLFLCPSQVEWDFWIT